MCPWTEDPRTISPDFELRDQMYHRHFFWSLAFKDSTQVLKKRLERLWWIWLCSCASSLCYSVAHLPSPPRRLKVKGTERKGNNTPNKPTLLLNGMHVRDERTDLHREAVRWSVCEVVPFLVIVFIGRALLISIRKPKRGFSGKTNSRQNKEGLKNAKDAEQHLVKAPLRNYPVGINYSSQDCLAKPGNIVQDT